MNTDSLDAILRERGVVVAPQTFALSASRLVVEPPVLILKRFRAGLRLQVGAFTMVHPGGDLHLVTLGRYGSIAPRVVLGGNEHAMGWLMQSSLMENPALYDWDKRLGREGEAVRGVHHDEAVRPVTIGHDVWIADGAFVRGGVTIGDGAVVGARAVVLRDVPPYAVVAGNPASLVRMRHPEVLIERLRAFAPWRFAPADLLKADVRDPAAALSRLEELEAAGRIAPYEAVLLETGTLARGAPSA